MAKGDTETYRRRGMPVDILVEDAGHAAPQENATNAAADRDRAEQWKKFTDHKEWSGAEPNRKPGTEATQKP